jgi:hypothetical protein
MLKIKKTAAVVANATVLKQGSVQCFKFISGFNCQSVSGLYKNFTRMSPTEFEYLIHMIFYCSATDVWVPYYLLLLIDVYKFYHSFLSPLHSEHTATKAAQK